MGESRNVIVFVSQTLHLCDLAEIPIIFWETSKISWRRSGIGVSTNNAAQKNCS